MRIITGNRGSGKTTELIKYAVENKIPILVLWRSQAEYIRERAKEIGVPCPEIYTFAEYRMELHGVGHPPKVCVDEIQNFLRFALDTDVDCITYDLTQKTEVEWLDGWFAPNPVETEDVRDRWDDMMQRWGKVIRECRGVESE